MTVTIDLVESAIFDQLRLWLLAIVPAGVEVWQGQANRTPPPLGTDYVFYWPTRRLRLSTNIVTPGGTFPAWDEMNYKQPLEMGVQIDVHGPNSANIATIISTLARSEYATQFFDATGLAVQMLYADDPRQLAFITGEQQYENRWSIDCALQANPVTTTVQQFADAVQVGLIEVDTHYPPGDG